MGRADLEATAEQRFEELLADDPSSGDNRPLEGKLAAGQDAAEVAGVRLLLNVFEVFAKDLADIGLGVWWSSCPSNWPALASSYQASKW